MIAQVGSCRVELVQGDVTLQQVDAIVNAANAQLAGGGGVDGAIHRAAGRILKLQTSTRYPQGCPPGDAVATDAGNLPARYVFHAVGPVWNGGQRGESTILASAFRRCLELAVEHDCRSIAFPAISTGVYGYPLEEAAAIAVREVRRSLEAPEGSVRQATFVLFGRGSFEAFRAAVDAIPA
jgi:O-acetyl-ADP-ribose deacetylase (regulator of RNase III)